MYYYCTYYHILGRNFFSFVILGDRSFPKPPSRRTSSDSRPPPEALCLQWDVRRVPEASEEHRLPRRPRNRARHLIAQQPQQVRAATTSLQTFCRRLPQRHRSHQRSLRRGRLPHRPFNLAPLRWQFPQTAVRKHGHGSLGQQHALHPLLQTRRHHGGRRRRQRSFWKSQTRKQNQRFSASYLSETDKLVFLVLNGKCKKTERQLFVRLVLNQRQIDKTASKMKKKQIIYCLKRKFEMIIEPRTYQSFWLLKFLLNELPTTVYHRTLRYNIEQKEISKIALSFKLP
jgi:hypothetical protein